jgi:hypothetical protein
MASEAAGELALLAAAPGPNQAVGGEGEGVVGSAGDLGDVAEAGDQNWRGLFFDEFAVGVEAKTFFSFGVLFQIVSTTRRVFQSKTSL